MQIQEILNDKIIDGICDTCGDAVIVDNDIENDGAKL